MKREFPRLALVLLDRFLPDGPALAGDLIEQYEQRPSRWRVWREVLAAVVCAWRTRGQEIRPLRLSDLQPADAVDRTRRFTLRQTPVNLTASPVSGLGGLAGAILLLLMTAVQPGAWFVFGLSVLAGVALAVALIAAHRPRLG